MFSRRSLFAKLSLIGLSLLARNNKPEKCAAYVGNKPTMYKTACYRDDLEGLSCVMIRGRRFCLATFRGVKRQVIGFGQNEFDGKYFVMMGFREDELVMESNFDHAVYYNELLMQDLEKVSAAERVRDEKFIGPVTMRSRPCRTTKPRFV